MKKFYVLLSLVLLLISLAIILVTLNNNFAMWEGWSAVSSISTFFTSVGLFFVIYQIFLQKRSYNIDELNYVMNFTERFIEANKKYNDAFPILTKYNNEIPKVMDEEEYNILVEALTKYYEVAYLYYQVIQLVENKIIDIKTFYVLQFNNLTQYPDSILSTLHFWLETGIDLASNYDRKELLTFTKSYITFYSKLYQLSKVNGIQGYNYQIEIFTAIENDLVGQNINSKRFVEINFNENINSCCHAP